MFYLEGGIANVLSPSTCFSHHGAMLKGLGDFYQDAEVIT